MDMTYGLWCWKNCNLGETIKARQPKGAHGFKRHVLRFTLLDNSQSKLVFSVHLIAITVFYCTSI